MGSTQPPTAGMHEGSCFCGAVRVSVRGEPLGMGYCHCQSCRTWSASPVNGFSLWKPEAVAITQGADQVVTYNQTPRSFRKWCRKCGGHLMTDHPQWGLVDVFAAMLPTLSFKPAVHVNYAESVLRIRDGLPKLRDFPADLGGSGESVPE
jgi:hypothetical protein